MRQRLHALLCTALCLTTAHAAPPADEGLSRMHEFRDWVVACDNTRACQAQGYGNEGEDPGLRRAALLVQRAAGPGQPPTLQLRFASAAPEDRAPEAGLPVLLRAGRWQQTLPPVDPRTEELAVPQPLVPGLLAAALKARRLELQAGSGRWTVSLEGAHAALLKMDELQRRLDTPGALVRRGSRAESGVPQPAPPTVAALALPPTTAADQALEPRLRAALPRPDDDCPGFDPGEPLAHLVRLDAGSLLVSQRCLRGAYQSASRLWRVQDRPPHRATLLKPPRPEPQPGVDGGLLVLEWLAGDVGWLELQESAKGRGMDDCGSILTWTWTARGLALMSATTSPCRNFEGGGIGLTLWRTEQR